MTWLNRTHIGDCRELLVQMAAGGVRVQTCVTSPPYFGLRDYGNAAQIGLEETPEAYVAQLVRVFAAVREVLADDGTLWLNLGDSYACAPGGGQGKNGARFSRTFTARIDHDKRSVARPGNPEKNGGNSNRNGVMNSDVPAKNLIGIPWRVAFALQADGWYLRSDIIWQKPNPMPESVTDRPTKSHEYLFLLSKRAQYYYDADAIREQGAGRTDLGKMRFDGRVNRGGWRNDGGDKEADGRNRRTVWTIPTQPFTGAHFACFPPALIEPCILAGSPPGGIVLDPFMGSGTTAQVATNLGRQFIGCELNPAYVALHEMRTTTTGMAI